MRLFALIVFAATLPLRADDITTTDGKVYKNAKIISHDDRSVTILCSDGGATIALSSLTPTMQKKLVPQPDPAPEQPISPDEQYAYMSTPEYANGSKEETAGGGGEQYPGAFYKYDKFRDYCLLSTAEYSIRDDTTFQIGLISEGKTPKRPDRLKVTIYRVGEDWEFLDDHDVIFLSDDVRFPVSQSTRDGSVYDSGRVGEFVYFDLTPAAAKKIFTGSKVSLAVGSQEFELDPDVVSGLVRYLSLVEGLQPESTLPLVLAPKSP